MKKILVVIMLLTFLAPAAFAFSVPEEVQVVSAPAYVAAPESSSSFSMKAVKNAVSRGMASVNKKIAALKAEVIKKDTATAKSVDALGRKIDGQNIEIKGEIKKVGDGVKNLDNKLTDKKNGEFKKLTDHVWSASRELNSTVTIWMVALGLVLILLGALAFFLLKRILNRFEKKLDSVDVKIDDIPEQTASRVKTLDLLTIELKDVLGHEVIFNPEIVDGMYNSLYVPKTITVSAADPAQTVRVRMTDKGKLRRSTRDVMEEYFSGAFDGSDVHSVEQKRLVQHLISTGELVVR